MQQKKNLEIYSPPPRQKESLDFSLLDDYAKYSKDVFPQQHPFSVECNLPLALPPPKAVGLYSSEPPIEENAFPIQLPHGLREHATSLFAPYFSQPASATVMYLCTSPLSPIHPPSRSRREGFLLLPPLTQLPGNLRHWCFIPLKETPVPYTRNVACNITRVLHLGCKP